MKVYTLNADALKELMSLIQETTTRDYDSPKYSESSPMLEETYDDVDDYDAYDDYMADAMDYLDKAYEYLGKTDHTQKQASVKQKPCSYSETYYTKPEPKPAQKHRCSCEAEKPHVCKCKSKSRIPQVTRVIFNDPDTTVFFDDGTISHVKTVAGDKFDKEHGILYAIFKRLYGRHGEREGMYGLMPGAGASLLLQQMVKNADDLKECKTASKKVKSEPAPDYQPQPTANANRRWYSRTIKK